jgi:hypothetical protein
MRNQYRGFPHRAPRRLSSGRHIIEREKGGRYKILTVSQLKRLVANGTIHFFLLSGSGGNGAGGSGFGHLPGRFRGFGNANLPSGDTNLDSVNNDLIKWIQSTCSVVPSSKYETASSSTPRTQLGGPGGGFGSQSPGTLYDCTIK